MVKAWVRRDRKYRKEAESQMDQGVQFKLAKALLKGHRTWWLQGKKFSGNLVRLNRRCLDTGRSASVLRSHRLSRLSFRRFYKAGLLFGVKKSSW